MEPLQSDIDHIINRVLNDQAVRRDLTRKSHYWFFAIFLPHYIKYEMALFHRDMFRISEEPLKKLTVIMAFRGSGKSTVLNTSLALWAILGVMKKRFVLIVSKTQAQAKNHFRSIRDELESNTLLAKDLGPFQADETSWGQSSLVLTKMNARITAASREQSLRGLRHGYMRPDLIICDDLEDMASAQTATDRNATHQWFTSEVVPLGDLNTNIIVLGNLLHENSLLMRLRSEIQDQKIEGIFRAYPFSDDYGQVLWPGKFPTKEAIEDFELSTQDDDHWNREYLLKYVPEHQLLALHAFADAHEQGKDTHAGESAEHLGPYCISAPKQTFNLFSRLHDHWLHEMSRADPAEAITRLRGIADTHDAFTHRCDWSWWTTLRNKETLKEILRAALASTDERAQQDARQSIQEIVATGHSEFEALLSSSA